MLTHIRYVKVLFCDICLMPHLLFIIIRQEATYVKNNHLIMGSFIARQDTLLFFFFNRNGTLCELRLLRVTTGKQTTRWQKGTDAVGAGAHRLAGAFGFTRTLWS